MLAESLALEHFQRPLIELASFAVVAVAPTDETERG
jgi:hypothetical protein